MSDKTVHTVFRSFIRELTRTTPVPYSNHPKVIQSSVGMIFRLKSQNAFSSLQHILNGSFEGIDLLFTQRAGYEKDRNAYNIVFPGGQCDGKETDLEACKRELMEEVNLKTEQQCVYLGQLPNNFYYLKKRGSKVFISCHIWCMKADQYSWKPKLNPEQLRDYRWVPYSELLDPSNYLETNAMRLGIIERALPARIAANISRNISSFKLPQLNLGMDRCLWGLTLWIWSYSLQMARRGLIDSIATQTTNKSIVKVLGQAINHSKLLQVNFKPYYPFKYPLLGLLRGWHVLNRQRPFSYQRRPETRAKLMLIGLLLLVAVIYSVLEGLF